MEKLKYDVLENLDDYVNKEIPHDATVCRRPLFHGTTRFAIDADPAVLSAFYDHCKTIVQKARVYSRALPDKEAFHKSLDRLIEEKKISVDWAHVYTFGTLRDYSYGDFYVTTGYLRALHYRKNAGGELGKLAYNVALALEYLGIDLGIEESVSFVKKLYPSFAESESVVLIAENVAFSDLFTEHGDPFLPDKDSPWYAEDVVFSLTEIYEEEIESEGKSSVDSYRVAHPENYRFKMIPSALLREGIGLFTKISDVDRFLESPTSFDLRRKNAEDYGV